MILATFFAIVASFKITPILFGKLSVFSADFWPGGN
jgi:hypothetical protein